MLLTFFAALVVSYLGSIPPGMINVTTLQYSIEGRKSAAVSFIIACVLVEFIYTGIAVKFQMYLTENANINGYFQLITAAVLVGLGIVNLFKKKLNNPKPVVGEKRSAFKRGTLISLGNPLAIPFWLAVTAYLQNQDLVVLTGIGFWVYLAGVSIGTFGLLITVVLVSRRFSLLMKNSTMVYRIPGLLFIGMGGWSFLEWLRLV
ncbi:MAG: LysE family transporter [Cyclobacteriaceae bacterium]